uniref:Gustatory receptor n=1 Tax=Anopheles funestus TaxID=62324 RepID=A0A182RG20_ANOFN
MDVFGFENNREYTVSWWPKISDHIQALSTIWNTSRAFGAFTVPFNPRTDKPTTIELLSSTVLTAIRLYMIYVVFTTDSWDLMFTSSSQYVEKGMDILLKIPIVLVVIFPWIFLLRKVQFIQISYDIGVFDKQMLKYNHPLNYQFFHIFATLFTIVNVVVPLIILVAMRGVRFWMEHFIVLTFIGSSWSSGLMFNTVFNILLYHILYRVQVINDLLRYAKCQFSKMTSRGNTTANKKFPFLFFRKLLYQDRFQLDTANTLALIKTIMRLHDKLGDIANNCSRCFAITTVLTMIHVLVSQILTTFALIRVVFYHYDAIELKDCILYIIGTTTYCWMPICTIWMAGDIKKRTIVTWKLIHRFINTTDDIEVEDLLQQFSEQMNHRSPSIDFRFFDVDWPLLVKACSEAATYLIIMIQFDVKK